MPNTANAGFKTIKLYTIPDKKYRTPASKQQRGQLTIFHEKIHMDRDVNVLPHANTQKEYRLIFISRCEIPSDNMSLSWKKHTLLYMATWYDWTAISINTRNQFVGTWQVEKEFQLATWITMSNSRRLKFWTSFHLDAPSLIPYRCYLPYIYINRYFIDAHRLAILVYNAGCSVILCIIWRRVIFPWGKQMTPPIVYIL